MRGKPFIRHQFVGHTFVQQSGSLLDRTIQRVFGHGRFFSLLNRQAQSWIHVRVGPLRGGNNDFSRQFSENATSGIGSGRFCVWLSIERPWNLSLRWWKVAHYRGSGLRITVFDPWTGSRVGRRAAWLPVDQTLQATDFCHLGANVEKSDSGDSHPAMRPLLRNSTSRDPASRHHHSSAGPDSDREGSG